MKVIRNKTTDGSKFFVCGACESVIQAFEGEYRVVHREEDEVYMAVCPRCNGAVGTVLKRVKPTKLKAKTPSVRTKKGRG